jgi:hypothetical protein
MDMVYIKNKGKKDNWQTIDVDNIIQQEKLNQRRNLEPSHAVHTNDLISGKNNLARQLQEEDN